MAAASRHDADAGFVAGVIALVLAVTSLPYGYAYWSAPPDRHFMGILVNAPDHAQYFAWMRGLSEASRMSNTLTPEPNPPLFFNLLWWVVGRSARWLGLGYGGGLQLLRLIATPLFLIVVHRLCRLFLVDRLQRRTAFLVVTFTSGFGWILVVLKYTVTAGELRAPLDVFIAEGNTFYCALAQAHFLAAGLYVVVFELLLRGEVSGRLGWAVAAGLIACALGWQHTYDLASIYAVILGYAIMRSARDRRVPTYLVEAGLVIGALSWWPGAYSVWLTHVEPTWRAVLAQFGNAGVFTPTPPHLVVLLGPAFVLALVAVLRDRPLWLRGLDDRQLFLRAWFLTTGAIIYLPVGWQIHLLNGWQVPIAILATQTWFGVVIPACARRLPAVDGVRLRRWMAVALVALVLPTNVYLFAWRFVDLGRHAHPYYLSTDELAALDWLDAHTQPGDVVLSSQVIGQYVPALAGAHAFLAHWAQTVDYYGKERAVRAFFAPATSDAERRAIVAQAGVDYVFVGDAERGLGSYPPASASFLQQVFQRGHVAVFKVGPDPRAP